MAFPKIELFPEFDQRVSYYGRALGHPARMGILEIIESRGSIQVIDLEKLLPLSQGTITAHLKKLRLAGLIDVEVIGLKNIYTLNREGVHAMIHVHRTIAKLLISAENPKSSWLTAGVLREPVPNH